MCTLSSYVKYFLYLLFKLSTFIIFILDLLSCAVRITFKILNLLDVTSCIITENTNFFIYSFRIRFYSNNFRF